MFFLLGAFVVICYFTISAKGFYDFVPNKRTLSPKQISQENFRQAGFFLGSLELHRTVFPTWKSLTVNVAHPCATSVNFYWILFADSIGSDDKESACTAGDLGSIPGPGRSPEEGNSNPLQYSCLENSMERGAWQATVHGVAKESDIAEQSILKRNK